MKKDKKDNTKIAQFYIYENKHLLIIMKFLSQKTILNNLYYWETLSIHFIWRRIYCRNQINFYM